MTHPGVIDKILARTGFSIGVLRTNPTRTLALAFLAPLVFSLGTSAQEPRENLKPLIERLRKNPADGALREEVIRLARDMTPPPATPREALQHEAAGHGLFKTAKSRQDCLAAAHEYELALRLAPWVAPLYFALG